MEFVYDFSLLDEDFLTDLQMQRQREIYARVTLLDKDENPVEYIEGKVSSGSINIDGNSIVRRTCNLSMVSEDININDFYWGLKTKVKIDIGLKNEINSNYPDIIWFPQGIYVLSAFNTSLNSSGKTISLSGKDKMSLLNGDLSGQIFASVDFGTEESYQTVFEPITISKNNFKANTYYADNSGTTLIEDSAFDNVDTVNAYEKNLQYSIKKIPLEKIIREGVHAFALEPYHNIIINDLDNYGLEQLTYKGENTIYALRNKETGHFQTLVLSGRVNALDNILESFNDVQFDSLNQAFADNGCRIIYYQNHTYKTAPDSGSGYVEYTVAKINYGDDIGYRLTDLVYSGDLISNLGESFTSVLEKIKTMLGDFEYFYDISGQFIFQRKKTYVNTSYSLLTNSGDETYVSYAAGQKKCVFNFEDNKLISAFQNSPVLNNAKNDYSIWGKRIGISGAEIPIHMRFAIDKKPVYYKNLVGDIYYSNKLKDIPMQGELVDWREIIYQMALDYFAGQGCSPSKPIKSKDGTENILITPDHFLSVVAANNPDYYPSGYTGYEQYYTDIQGFWRQLYNPHPEVTYNIDGGYFGYEKTNESETTGYYELTQTYYRPTINAESVNSEFYFKDIESFNASLSMELSAAILEAGVDVSRYISAERAYWNLNIFEAPETLNFWIDFLDSNSELAELSVPMIGSRTKTINDDKVTAIFYKDIPDIILSSRGESEDWIDITSKRSEIQKNSGYTFVFLPQGMEQLFTISYRGKSAKDKLDQLLYENAYCIENVTITSLPLYNLQPNNRIYIKDQETKINGEYLVSKFSLSLAFDGTMSITATKAPERLY